MKRTFLLLALLGAVIYGYSQSLEDLGDEAFLQGRYAEAEAYYRQANDLESSKMLKEKINKSKTLKTDFEIIDRAIADSDYDKAKIHIDNVLRVDPGNLWVNERKSKLGIKQTKERFKGFDGEYFPDMIEHGIFFSAGARYDIINEMICPIFKVSYNNYRHFPFTIDYAYQFFNYAYDKDVNLNTLGVGSAYILSRRWTIDFGTGVMWSMKKYIPTYESQYNPNTGETSLVKTDRPYRGLYFRAGVTFSHFLSVYWNLSLTTDYPYYPINASYLMLTYPLSLP